MSVSSGGDPTQLAVLEDQFDAVKSCSITSCLGFVKAHVEAFAGPCSAEVSAAIDVSHPSHRCLPCRKPLQAFLQGLSEVNGACLTELESPWATSAGLPPAQVPAVPSEVGGACHTEPYHRSHRRHLQPALPAAAGQLPECSLAAAQPGEPNPAGHAFKALSCAAID